MTFAALLLSVTRGDRFTLSRAGPGRALFDSGVARVPVRPNTSFNPPTTRKDPNQMTTATKQKGGVLAELKQLEAAWADAERRARAASVEHYSTLNRARELVDERQRVAHRDPALVDYLGNPAEPDNPIAKLDAQLGELGDLDELAARGRHAAEVSAKRKIDAYAFIGPNFERIIAALKNEAEAKRDAVQATAAAFTDAAEGYFGFAQRVDGLRAADRRLARVRVPAIEAGAELMRVAHGYRDTPLPLGTELR